jgi:hypothetical protein
MAAEMKYITGKGDAISATRDMASSVLPESILSAMDSAASGLGNMGKSILRKTGMSDEKIDKGIKQWSKLLENSDIDFPSIWGGSSFSASRTITVKLVNPDTRNDDFHMQYIVEPAARLLSLACPLSDSASTYSYPPIVQVNCPGLFYMSSGYVTIDINKGGNENDISFEQRVGTLELQLTFTGMYDSMIAVTAEDAEDADVNRPTLKDYIRNLDNRYETRNWRNASNNSTNNTVSPKTKTYSAPTTSVPKSDRVNPEMIAAANKLAEQSGASPAIIPDAPF